MLEVVRNTYPGVDLQPGDKVEWVYQKGCFRLYKHPYQNTISKSYFATPECTIDGIKLNGKPVILIGIVGQLKNKGWVLELKQVDVILEDDLSFDISDRLDEAAKSTAKQAIKPGCEIAEIEVADEKYTVQDMEANYITRLLKKSGNILKTCPMCGAEAKIESNQVGTAFRVSCIKIHKCGLTQHWFDSEQKAILAWNRRSGVCGD